MINGGQASHYIRGHLNSRVWVITALCILALVSLLVTLQTYKYSYDDAYITYRYASRLDTGLGFNYHTGETHSGTTAPGYALLLAILALPDPAAIPQISGWVGGISLLFVGIAVFLFGLRHKQPLTGFIASLVFIVCPYSLLTMGGEMLTMTALVMLGILAYDQDHPKLAGALIGFACVIRGDAALAGVILAVHSLLFRRKFPWGLAFGALISVLPWSIYAYFRYGSPLPNTLSIKIIQGQSGHWSHFLLGFIKYFAGELGISNRSDLLRHPVWLIFGIWVWVGFYTIISRWRFWLLPLAWVLLHAVCYQLMGVAFYHWYALPEIFGFAIVIGCGVSAFESSIIKMLHKLKPIKINPYTSKICTVINYSLLCLTLGMWVLIPIQGKLSIQAPSPYPSIGAWLVKATPQDASIGYIEIGKIGYFSGRDMVDPMGLVSDGAAPYILSGDLSWAYRDLLPDYVIVNHSFDEFLGSYQQEPWFANCYHLVNTIQEIEIYKRCNAVSQQDMVMVRPLQQKSVKPTGELKPGQVIGQTFTSHEENLRGVSLLFGTYGKLWKGKLVFHLQEANDIGSNKDIVTLVSDSASVPDNLWKIFNFPTIFQSNGKKYYVYIEVPKADPGQRLVLWSDPNGSYSEGSAYVNHHEISSDLAICLYYVKP